MRSETVKKIMSILLIVLLIFAGCSENSITPEQPAEAAPPETTITTISKTTENPTEPQLNTDLFSDLNLTFAQLTEKYGKVINAGRSHHTGFWYVFKNSDYHYIWKWDDVEDSSSIWERNSDTPFDDDITKQLQGIKCREISGFSLDELFTGLQLPATIFDVEEGFKSSHISHDRTYWNLYGGRPSTIFSYKDDVAVYIATFNDVNWEDIDSNNCYLVNYLAECTCNNACKQADISPLVVFDDESYVRLYKLQNEETEKLLK